MKISIGWVNKEGYSEEQMKSFSDKDMAFNFCKKHLENGNITRINGVRFHRDFEDSNEDKIKIITDDEIMAAIYESQN